MNVAIAIAANAARLWSLRSYPVSKTHWTGIQNPQQDAGPMRYRKPAYKPHVHVNSRYPAWSFKPQQQKMCRAVGFLGTWQQDTSYAASFAHDILLKGVFAHISHFACPFESVSRPEGALFFVIPIFTDSRAGRDGRSCSHYLLQDENFDDLWREYPLHRLLVGKLSVIQTHPSKAIIIESWELPRCLQEGRCTWVYGRGSPR